ncbi:MAG: hypothetical protein IJS50_02990, partial [Desulfovibrio sp.]|nr:hypothetical protein [Desulfovibrio sp.]
MARCILEMKNPMHCGRGSDGSNTSPVTTDAYGFWRIPGSSVAGVLRNHVRINRGEELACELFGREERGPNQSSLVWVSDAVLLDYDGAPLWKKVVAGQEPLLQIMTFFRDRVSLDFVTGTVEKGKKFNEEYVPAGTRFALEILLNNWEDELDPKVLEAFAFVVKSLELGQVHFGGKSSCGYGSYRLLTAQLRKLDPHDPKQMEQWLQLLDSPLYPEKFGQPWEAVPTKAMPKTDSISGL